jgi:23S rRNA (adenine2503-C2)-methyltransferase
MKFVNSYYLPSGRAFVLQTDDGYLIECTEMRDVSVGGKENYEVRNSLDPRVVWRHVVDYEDKWLLTVSTQKGCAYNCQFCDVAKLPFKGNLSTEEILQQIEFLLNSTPYVNRSSKVKIGFARMGEPSHNLDNVLEAMVMLPIISKTKDKEFIWLPCFNSILPRKVSGGYSGFTVIEKVLEVKNRIFDGFLHFQISVNSTDEEVRKILFGNADVLTIEEIVKYINKSNIRNRTVTLNFIVMKGISIDIEYLMKLRLNKDKFTVKLIPLNKTWNAKEHKLKTVANYENYKELEKIKREFISRGVPVVIDAIAKCEEAGLCCGQLVQL